MAMPTGANPTINDIIKSINDGDYRIPRFQWELWCLSPMS